ncbi:MAG: hypothetical protein GKC03_09210 [Methanomassiliicoccales archaeon]|nr:hypothetical protein [Methanomassiliicoccales archaeon]NYT14626.1 hypothetical protein [Methanomassiliicoccales archaeon]
MTDAGESPDQDSILVELSCKDRKCDPCTYPNCSRFVRLEGLSKHPKWKELINKEL